jgi:hypothetical protein
MSFGVFNGVVRVGAGDLESCWRSASVGAPISPKRL